MIRRAIILAAGSGRKMWPYGEFRQKCAIPVANQPAIRRTCQSLSAVGITEMAIVTSHHGQQVMGATADLKGVTYVEQQSLDGGAVAARLAYAERFEGEDVLVVHGDIVTTTAVLRAFVDGFAETDLEAGALLAPLEDEEAGDWICGSMGGDLLTDVKGHPRGGSHRMAGVYALKASAADCLARNPGFAARVDVGGMPPAEADMAGSMQVLLDDDRDVFAQAAQDFVVDMDKPWHALQANARMVDHLCAQIDETTAADGVEISDGADIDGKIIVGANTRIGKRVVLRGGAVIGANCDITNGANLHGRFVIGDRCRISDYCDVGGSSSIGNRCVIGHGAEFSGVLLDKVYLYHYCEMSGFFGEATDIGAATVCGTLRFDDRDTPHEVGGRKEIPAYGANATYMGDFCRTGVNAILMPGVKVGSYSCVGPGVILYDDMPAKELVLAKQELVRSPWGPEKYGW